ncbi:MAG: penicillin acylase family protein [Gemmatimonadota bacterium]
MKKLVLALALAAVACGGGPSADPEVRRWEERAQATTIVRDDWGIAHVRADTDANAVFGMIYAQAEDDFNRIEVNYLNAMGRLAEAEGESELWRDLRMKLFIDPAELQRLYGESPVWLQQLMDAWADGLNYYLHTHPDVQPRVLTRFEPWMALSFTEGSIGGDIERVSLGDLERFYGEGAGVPATAGTASGDGPDDGFPAEPTGSNGFAIAPSNSASGNALLWINPHTSFYFRAELQMTSAEGVNAYGAVTWGQFFVYQGFNETAGWMHTSSGADAIDEFAETIVERDGERFYVVGDEERPLRTTELTVPYRDGTGLTERTFTVYHTHRGPVIREEDGKWISIGLMNDPVQALTQSWSRTKARNFDEFKETMQLHTNSSNNTVFADAEGNIAYFHANFVPRRDPRFDWNAPVDGSDPATEWQGLHSVDESPLVLNPPNGWIQNTNNWPFSAAGPNSPRQEDFPAYMETFPENPRGINAVRVLQGKTDFTLESLRDAAFDPFLPAFVDLIPPLVRAWERLPTSDPLKDRLEGPIDALRDWDLTWSVESVPTSLAVFWGEELWSRIGRDARAAGMSQYDYMARRASDRERLEALATVVEQLETDFGAWATPWGDINRFQRLTGDIVQPFDDSQPSIPVGFTSSRWGSLAAYGVANYGDTKKIYGTRGNSFVAGVEFGDSVRAIAITAGGQSGDPASPHFDDQAERYTTGDLRTVYFYPNQLDGHTEREYRPGS